jgi:hypothetical protein
MGHVVATYYNRIVVELTSPIIGVSETFFPLRSSPPKDPSSQFLVLGLIPNHFVYVKLKSDALILKTSETWRQYCSDETMEWEYTFMDRQTHFEEMMDIERAAVVKKKKVKKVVGVGSSINNSLTCSNDSD